MIQLVANINQKGRCPMAAGDTLHVEIWNPQTMARATYQTAAVAP
jgi:hypothetical protein